jgi:hypothetical protein
MDTHDFVNDIYNSNRKSPSRNAVATAAPLKVNVDSDDSSGGGKKVEKAEKAEKKTVYYYNKSDIPEGYVIGDEIVGGSSENNRSSGGASVEKRRRPEFLSKNWFWFTCAGVGAVGIAALVIGVRFKMIGSNSDDSSLEEIQTLNKKRQEAVVVGVIAAIAVGGLTLLISKVVFKWTLKGGSG